MATYREVVSLLDAFVRAVEFDNPPKKNGGLMKAAKQLLVDAKRGDQRPSRWTPFERSSADIDQTYVANTAARLDMPENLLRAFLERDMTDMQMFLNSRYQVQRRDLDNHVWLSIKRIDQGQNHSWRDLQRIKNELVGPECEFMELYPAESRLVDTANQYMLWGKKDPTFRFPVGFTDRQVSYETKIGEGQTPLEQEGAH
jgi:hypothetical protein